MSTAESVNTKFLSSGTPDAPITPPAPVGDLIYLPRETVLDDQANVCERVFLHKRMLGMWGPEDRHRTVCAVRQRWRSPCVRRLSRDEAAVAELRALREARARADPVKAFCRRCQVGPLEARELREGQCWAGWPEKRAELLPAAARTGSSFP